MRIFLLIFFLFSSLQAQFQPNHLYVKLKSGYQHEFHSLQNEYKKMGCKKITQKYPHHQAEGFNPDGYALINLSLWYDIEVDDTKSVMDWCKIFQKNMAVAYAEPVYSYELMYVPNDPSIPGLLASSMWWLNKLQAFNAWDINKGSTSTIIGISDTGFDLDHPEMGVDLYLNPGEVLDGFDNDGNGKVDDLNGWDFVGAFSLAPFGDNNPSATATSNWHGVNVSGLAAARADNATTICSPAFKTRWMPLKIMADNGGSLQFGYESIVYGADLGCTVINCSWGGTNFSQFGQDVVSYASINKNCAVVAAAGNTSGDLKFYPAAFDHVLSVTGTSAGDFLGAVTYNYTVDVSGPCRNIRMIQYNNAYTTTTGACYTSYAAPFASSTIALIKSQFPAYNALQLMERLRVTSDDVYALNPPAVQDKMGKGRINMFKALSVVTPAFRQENVNLSNKPYSGNTLNLILDFRNFLDPSINANVTLSTTHPDITVLSSNFNLGAVSTLNVVDNSSSPFSIQISPSATLNQEVFFRLSYNDPANSYTDFEYFSIIINPEFENITTNLLHTTANAKGNIGYHDYNLNSQGLGVLYNGSTQSWLYESGFLVGRSATQVSDRIRNPFVQDTDFEPISPFRQQIPGLYSDADGMAIVQDTQSTQLGVNIRMNTYVWNETAHQNYVIFQYNIRNEGATDLTNVYAGIFADWDLPPYQTNHSNFDSVSKTVFAHNFDSTNYAGIRLLTWDSLHVRSLTGFDAFNYSTSSKYAALSQGTTNAASGPSDIMHFISTGPFTILAGDSHTVAFALLAGEHWNEIKNGGDSSLSKYVCDVLAAKPHLSFQNPNLNFTETTTAALGCQNFTDQIFNLNLDAPTLFDTQILIFPDSSSTTDSLDFQILPSSLINIPAGSVGNIPITLRIFDDAAEESTEHLVLKYKFVTRRDLIPHCENQTLTVQISDNDLVISPYLIESDLLSISEYLGPNQKVWFKNPLNDEILACIENLDNHDYGCTTIEIDRTGTGAIAFQQPLTDRFATQKTYLVSPDHNFVNGTYRISLFYNDAELSGWEAVTGNSRTALNLFKSSGAIANVSPSNAGANGWNNVMGDNPILNTINTSDLMISSTFYTGFSGFAAGKDAPESPLPIQLISFSGTALANANLLKWSFSSTETQICQLQKLDNQNFKTIYSHTPQQNQDYIFEDDLFEEKEIYRLVTLDLNGKLSVLSTVEIIRDQVWFSFNQNQLQIFANEDFSISDLTGREIFKSSGSQMINVEQWPHSIYFIRFKESGKVVSIKR